MYARPRASKPVRAIDLFNPIRPFMHHTLATVPPCKSLTNTLTSTGSYFRSKTVIDYVTTSMHLCECRQHGAENFM